MSKLEMLLPANDKKDAGLSRRDFLKLAGGISLAGLLAACSSSTKLDLTPTPAPAALTPTRFPPTATSTPTATPTPQPTPTYSSSQLQGLLTSAEIDFLAHHEVSHGDSSRPVILMTYDDGGRDAYVEMILQAYASLNAKATFFIPGFWMANHSKTAEDIVAHGHLLGCHSYNHTPFTSMTKDAINQDIEDFLKLADQVLPGYRIRYFRFPYGSRNQNLRDIVAQWGMQSVMWDVESGGLTDSTYSAVVEHVSNGSLVLSHSSRYYDAKQAGLIVQELLKRGYSIETVAAGTAPQGQWKN